MKTLKHLSLLTFLIILVCKADKNDDVYEETSAKLQVLDTRKIIFYPSKGYMMEVPVSD